MIKIVLADDHVLVRDGIKALLEDQTGMTVIDEASNGKEALEVIAKNKPHVLIVDINWKRRPVNGLKTVITAKGGTRLKKTSPTRMFSHEI